MWKIVLPLLLFIGCKNTENTTKEHGNEDSKESKIWVSSTYSLCGGARPTPEQEQNARTPKSLAGKRLFLKSGTVNSFDNVIIDTLYSDDEGLVRLNLAPGDYLLVDENKKDKAAYDKYIEEYKDKQFFSPVDEECYLKYFKRPDISFSVPLDTTLQLNYHKGCFYHAKCSNYSGPYPP